MYRFPIDPGQGTVADNTTGKDSVWLDRQTAMLDYLEKLGLQLPLFVTCLFAGILITNGVPANFPRVTGTRWPTRTPAMALIADIALGTFLAMSLMSMQLWTLIDLAGPIVAILSTQFAIAVAINIFVVFRREFAGYFSTPLAYVFIVIFLALNGALTYYLRRFFERG